MKVLYVASNPEGSDSLRLEKEITELQLRFAKVSGEPPSFVFLPSLPIEELAASVSFHKPDILHISAHGSAAALFLANAAEKEIQLTAQMLRPLLDVEPLPRVLYLNACNSESIASELVNLIPMAVGTTAPITNRAARAAVILFYEKLFLGQTVQRAFEASRALIEALENSSTASKLYHRSDVRPESEILHFLPRIVARFANDDSAPDKENVYLVELGAIGCPRSTIQVVFFAVDEGLTVSNDGLADHLAIIVRKRPHRGEIWSENGWCVPGDFRISLCGVTASGDHFVLGSSICDALEFYAKLLSPSGTIDAAPRKAIKNLRRMAGIMINETME